MKYCIPYLTYCIEIWGNASDIYLDALIKIQKKNCSYYFKFRFLSSYR